MNDWWPEYHKRELRFQFIHTMNGYTKPYLTDDTGRLFRDETGNKDHVDTIPFELELGRNNFGDDRLKKFTSCYIESESARLATVNIQIDNGEWIEVGQLTSDTQKLTFPYALEGRDINYYITHNDDSSGPIIDGVTTYYTISETSV